MSPTSATSTSTGSIRGKATHQFFSYLQKNFGGLHSLFDKNTNENPAIIKRNGSDQILTEDLNKLMTHQCSAIHIRNFYHSLTSMEIGKELANEAISSDGVRMARNWKVSTARGLESSDVYTLGKHPPFNVVNGMIEKASKSIKENDDDNVESQHILDNYFDGVKKEFHDRRLKSIKTNYEDKIQKGANSEIDQEPRLWPLDKLRLELDEAWPGGAGLAREKVGPHRPFSGGLPRVMIGPTRWKKGFIHVDEMAPLSSTTGLFSANIYLQLPNTNESSEDMSGDMNIIKNSSNDGDLHIWPLGVRSRWDWYKVGYFFIIIMIY